MKSKCLQGKECTKCAQRVQELLQMLKKHHCSLQYGNCICVHIAQELTDLGYLTRYGKVNQKAY